MKYVTQRYLLFHTCNSEITVELIFILLFSSCRLGSFSNRGFLCSRGRGDIVFSNLLKVLDICVVTFSALHIQYMYLCISGLKIGFSKDDVYSNCIRF